MKRSSDQKSASGWFEFYADCLRLAGEAAVVLPLRVVRIAGGGRDGCAEAQRMVTEKIDAQASLIGALATGKFGSSPDAMAGGVVRHYLGYVRANRVRLTGAKR